MPDKVKADFKAGPKLNRAIIFYVMGWNPRESAYVEDSTGKTWNIGRRHDHEVPQFNPSTDIAAAWVVVEKLKDISHGDIHIECLHGEWAVSSCYDEDSWKNFSHADTAPLAVCLYALALKEKREKNETS